MNTSEDATAHERLVAALKASRAGTWRWDIAADKVEWDEALSQVYGLPHVQAPRTSSEFIQLVHPDDRERTGRLLGVVLESGSEIEYEFRALVDGRTVWIYDRSTLVRDAEGRPSYMTGACLDVTERKRIEQERDAALEAHRLLLRELTHRVSNHLQMVISMLALQRARQGEESVRTSLDKAIQRVHTIAGLHGHLYRDGDFRSVDMRAYLDGICDGLRGAVIVESGIELVCDAEPMRLAIDQAVPVGLVVSELATNAVKYAFPGERTGMITVRLVADEGRATLSVADDGCGMKASARSGNSGSGLGVVEGLVRQIGGTLTVDGSPGTSFSVTFTPVPG